MRHKALPRSQAPQPHTFIRRLIEQLQCRFRFYAQCVTIHVQDVLIETAVWTDSAIKRPKRMCACAIFAHTILSGRGDSEFGLLSLHVCKLCTQSAASGGTV